ncbi:MAG: hydroxyisourate hydrolase [Chloroflexota bacterium]|nr:hydroxyisourate hydrolase [Chloroflexota bacterium]
MTAQRRPSISTHVLDNERGEPARGVAVTLERRDGETFVPVAAAETNEDGRVPDLAGGDLRPGEYRISFDLGAYFDRQGDVAPFFRRATIDFEVRDVTRHYHVPLLATRFACASYCGS